MLPLIIGAGAVLLFKALFEGGDTNSKKKIFISFAIEDEKYRNHFVRQAKLERSPFEFTDMSIKEPIKQSGKKSAEQK